MRKRFGVGKPRCLQGQPAALWAALIMLWDLFLVAMGGTAGVSSLIPSLSKPSTGSTLAFKKIGFAGKPRSIQGIAAF